MMLDAEEGKKDQEEFVATYCCYFEVSWLLIDWHLAGLLSQSSDKTGWRLLLFFFFVTNLFGVMSYEC